MANSDGVRWDDKSYDEQPVTDVFVLGHRRREYLVSGKNTQGKSVFAVFSPKRQAYEWTMHKFLASCFAREEDAQEVVDAFLS